MERTGCNTRILHKVFEVTGRPPMFWITQQFLRPHFEIQEVGQGGHQTCADDQPSHSRQQEERTSASLELIPAQTPSSATDATDLATLQQIFRQIDQARDREEALEEAEDYEIELSSNAASDSESNHLD